MRKDERFAEISAGAEDKLFNFRPVLFAALFLGLGILFGYYKICKGVSSWWLMLWLPAAVTSFLFCRTRNRLFKRAVFLLVFALFFFAGAFSVRKQLCNFADGKSYNGEYTVIGRVTEKQTYENGCRITLGNVYIDGEGQKSKLIAYLPLSFGENVALSDEVLLQGEVTTDRSYYNDYGFRAGDIEAAVAFQMSDVETLIVTGKKFNLFHAVQTRVQRVVYAGMDKDAAAVTIAVLTGDTSGIESGLLENTRRGGIAHIFAVSGLHVGALYAFCLLLMKRTPLKKTPKLFRFLFTALLFIFYAGICGFSDSVVRAVVLCLISYAANLLGLKTDLQQSLGAAAIVVLLHSPVSLFEVGFQLSFAACAGIALLTRPLKIGLERLCDGTKRIFLKSGAASEKERAELLKPEYEKETKPLGIFATVKRAVISFLSVSIAAQLATSPFLLYSFGYLSGWSLLLNCLFVPLISALFSVLLIFVVVACILPVTVSKIVLYVPNVVWQTILLVFYAFDFSSFALSGIKLSVLSILLYIVFLSFLSDKWNLGKRTKRVLVLLLVLGITVTVYALNL